MLNVCGDTELMSTAMLELSEHELYFLPPDTPAIAPATRVEVDGKVFLARWEWCASGFSGFFYREERECAGISVVEVDSNPNHSEIIEQEKVEWIKRVIANGIGNRHWKPLKESFTAVFHTSPEFKEASVNWWSDAFIESSVDFRYSLPSREPDIDLSQCSQKTFLEFCERLLADEDSELNYALRWKELTTEAKDAIAFRCENGNWDTLRRLFTLVQMVVIYQFGGFPFPSPRGKSRWNFSRDLPMRPTKAVERATRWRAVICEIMLPSFWPDEPRCVSRWRSVQTSHQKMSQVRYSVPTYHEFLEAQLELREFLRPHLPSDEIEALMLP